MPVAIVLVLFGANAAGVGGSQVRIEASMTGEEIVAALGSADPWTDSNYRPDAWRRLCVLGSKLQRLPPEPVQDAIETFIQRTAWQQDSAQQWSKVFLLLRVMFELPQSIPASQAQFFGGWLIPYRIERIEAKVNLAWPLEWNDGKPKLVAGYAGYEGPPYRGGAEYAYYLRTYPFRDLSACSVASDARSDA